MQVEPPLPQSVLLVPAWHVSNSGSQHPLAQVAAPHPELADPPPVPAPPPPVPLTPQTPALHTWVPVHAEHAAPMRPHRIVVGGSTQRLPSQHPAQLALLHVAEVWHTPITQLCPDRHARHTPPSFPQAPWVVPARQLPVVDVHPVHTKF